MALTLKAAITATQTTVDVLGADALAEGDVYAIDSEYLVIRTATPATLRYGESAYQRVTVQRGIQGTAKAAHAAAATLTAVTPGGGGSGLPDEWTVAADDSPANYGDGALRIDLGTAGFGFEVAGPDDNGNANRFTVDLQDAQPKVSFGTRSGAEARVENDGSLYLYGRDNGSSNPWFWMYRTNGEGQKQVMIDFRSDASNRFTIFDNDLNPIFQVREDGSIHIPTGTSIVADL